MMGRLGNQMFIAAAAHSLALDNDDKVVYPNFLNGIIPTTREISIHRRTILRKLKYTDNLSFVENVYSEPPDHSYAEIPYKKNMFLRGYFQSEKYFKHNRQEILDLFEPQQEVERFLLKKYSNLIENKKCVSIHVRRGDYLKLSEFHAILGERYYDVARENFSSEHTFVFFSDDIEWCKQTFPGDKNVFIEKQDDVLDLYLMSKITNNIIANSSFSWWAAWLNEDENKVVVCPKEWFGPRNQHLCRKDLTPDNWITI